MRFSPALILLAAGLLMTACSRPAAAQIAPMTGYELRTLCTSASNLDYGICAGYVTSVAQVMLEQDIDGFRACNHANVRSQQLVDTFNGWAELFPQDLSGNADSAVAAALTRAFPCGMKGQAR